MKSFRVEVSQNAWEYKSFVFITANDVKQIGDEQDRTIVADGVVIKFDEQIGEISEVD